MMYTNMEGRDYMTVNGNVVLDVYGMKPGNKEYTREERAVLSALRAEAYGIEDAIVEMNE